MINYKQSKFRYRKHPGVSFPWGKYSKFFGFYRSKSNLDPLADIYNFAGRSSTCKFCNMSFHSICSSSHVWLEKCISFFVKCRLPGISHTFFLRNHTRCKSLSGFYHISSLLANIHFCTVCNDLPYKTNNIGPSFYSPKCMLYLSDYILCNSPSNPLLDQSHYIKDYLLHISLMCY